MTYRDDADALYARNQALEHDLKRLEAELEAARQGRARARNPDSWLGGLVARLPSAEQDLVVELVGLLVTRRDYPSLEGVAADSLEPLVTRLRALFSARGTVPGAAP
ncbi:MAG: hypothetical protein K8M05_18285 [Deltaproteobacteria bacterium]|nr:hypothetical protein [Kofleriaceae bacterium]